MPPPDDSECCCDLRNFGQGVGERGPTDVSADTPPFMKHMVDQIEARCGKATDNFSGMPADTTNRLNPR